MRLFLAPLLLTVFLTACQTLSDADRSSLAQLRNSVPTTSYNQAEKLKDDAFIQKIENKTFTHLPSRTLKQLQQTAVAFDPPGKAIYYQTCLDEIHSSEDRNGIADTFENVLRNPRLPADRKSFTRKVMNRIINYTPEEIETTCRCHAENSWNFTSTDKRPVFDKIVNGIDTTPEELSNILKKTDEEKASTLGMVCNIRALGLYEEMLSLR
ncbi:hypothetical protein O4H49_04355 [Kiloniella laminariae]|uniref:Lipoprotein n=1 Tax=Kiloniella laminariae TaxID=454162 RepID=A0ABT4LFX3_9PROT|nr:hypothetical protein [Kiloniella laminariae]MCZ4279997.1 hypothetical protein [Kiloniella laminariae]